MRLPNFEQGLTRMGLLIRSLMFLVCLVPFTSSRQAAAYSPGGNGSPTAPVFPPGSQEDDSEREEEIGGKAKERVPQNRAEPLLHLGRLTRIHTLPRHSRSVPTALAAPDPFHNGLGTPYRC